MIYCACVVLLSESTSLSTIPMTVGHLFSLWELVKQYWSYYFSSTNVTELLGAHEYLS